MPERKQIGWDDVTIPEETLSDEEFKGADSGVSNVPPGKYLCECVETRPSERQDSEGNYTYLAVNLKWKILKTLELNGKALGDKDEDPFEGNAIWDDVRLEHRLEKDGIKKRRHFVAKRLGLVTEEKKSITKKEWATGPIGKRMVVSTEEQSYTNKKGDKATIRKVKFGGYDLPPGEKQQEAGDGFDSI